jgi:hypothetical protein
VSVWYAEPVLNPISSKLGMTAPRAEIPGFVLRVLRMFAESK